MENPTKMDDLGVRKPLNLMRSSEAEGGSAPSRRAPRVHFGTGRRVGLSVWGERDGTSSKAHHVLMGIYQNCHW